MHERLKIKWSRHRTTMLEKVQKILLSRGFRALAFLEIEILPIINTFSLSQISDDVIKLSHQQEDSAKNSMFPFIR